MWITALLAVSALAVQSPPTRVEVEERWTQTFSGFGRFTIADGVLVLCQSDGVYANDPLTGNSRWARKDLAEGFGHPTVANGTVYVGAAKSADSDVPKDQATFALDSKSGETRWKSPFWAYEGVVSSGECVIGVGTQAPDGEITVTTLKSKDGSVAWTRKLDGLYKTCPQPKLAGDLVLCTSKDSIVALRAADGEIAWRSPPTELSMKFGARGNLVIAIGSDGNSGVVRGLLGSTGERKLAVPLKAPSTGLTFAAGSALVYAWDGTLLRLELDTGKERWSVKHGKGSSAAPLVVGETVLVQEITASGVKSKRSWIAADLASGALLGTALDVDDYDTLIEAGGFLWWSKPRAGTFKSLTFRRKP